MIGVVIVAHEPLGSGMLKSIAHILQGLERIEIQDIAPQDRPNDKIPLILQAILRANQAQGINQNQGVLILTDLIGATPANIAKQAVLKAREQGILCALLSGLNIGMLLRVLTSRFLPLDQIREKALEGGIQSILPIE